MGLISGLFRLGLTCMVVMSELGSKAYDLRYR